jgi:uncharacterized protein YjgD (DUF1641 family)
MTTTVPPPAPPAPPRSSEAELRDEIRALNRKIDRLADHVAYIHERTRAAVEFRDEAVPVLKDVVAVVSEELTATEQEFNTDEILHVVRKVLRGTPRIAWALDQLDLAGDFVQEFTPIARELMNSGIETLDKAEQRGYFRLLAGAAKMADQVGDHFSQRDIDAFAQAFPTILQTMKRLTQPAILSLASRTVAAVETLTPETVTPLSMWGAFRAMGEPEVQRGLGMAIELLRRIATAPRASLPPPPPSSPLAVR